MINVLIIDSGVVKHPKLCAANISAIGFRGQQSSEDILDTVGHGTAVASLVSKGADVDKVRIYAVRLFENFYDCAIDDLIECLEYIVTNNVYDVINMSFGIVSGYDYEQLERLSTLCNTLKSQGTILVSAYDNEGAISYPAFFDCVVGVDSSQKVNKRTKFEIVKKSCVNILGYGKNQKVAWVDPSYTIIEGNSFACANVSNVIIKLLVSGCAKGEIEKELEKQAIGIKEFDEFEMPPSRPLWLKGSKVITFPFNKEMHSIYAYEDMLDFEITAAYDVKYKALVGKNIADILSYKEVKSRIINNFDDINWKSDSFNGIIVGHVGEISATCKRNFLEDIISNCIKYGKKMFALDDLNDYISKFSNKAYFDANCYFPEVTYRNIPKGRFGKLFGVQMPVLGVVGTSSSQGKFTVQVALRKQLIDCGYKVGQIGTEPTAFCFGMDFTYPYGYESTVATSGYHNVLLLNQVIHDIEMQGCDICLVGSQTNSAAYAYSNLQNIPLFQADFLYGTMPDAFFLVVNVHDRTDYIVRTMKTVENMIESKCIGIIVYPIMQKQAIGTLYKKAHVSDTEYEEFSGQLTKEVNVPIVKFENVLDTDVLVDLVLNFFAE